MTTTQTATGPKVVKRYANRKLYDTETSQYVTLGKIVGFIKEGREIQVIDNLTKVDITGNTLLLALVETETATDATKAGTLRDIIKAGGLTQYVNGLKNSASDAFDRGINAEADNE